MDGGFFAEEVGAVEGFGGVAAERRGGFGDARAREQEERRVQGGKHYFGAWHAYIFGVEIVGVHCLKTRPHLSTAFLRVFSLYMRSP